MLNTEH